MKAQNKDYITMIDYAIKAPSGHNTQPWKFRIGDNRIEILPDFSKKLPVVDRDNRELFISLGCAAENLCITASTLNYATEMLISEEGVITILLHKSEVKYDSLFSQYRNDKLTEKYMSIVRLKVILFTNYFLTSLKMKIFISTPG